MANGATVGQLNVNLSLESATFEKGLNRARSQLDKAQKSFAAAGDKLTNLGKNLSIGMTAPLLAIGAASIKGAQDQAAAMAQVNAAIKSMGNQAGLSGEQLSQFADKLELTSLNDADEILRKSTANLLTFGNIAGENFLKAQQAAVDLATRMEGDLQGATLMVGKALNDPIKGLTALSRAGIQFTDQQKAQIKAMQEAGNVAGAQKIMLAELQKQFGGSAEAAAQADPMRQVMVKLGQAGDVIGEKLLPILPVITDAIVKVIEGFTALSPATQEWVVIGGALAAALGPVVLGIGGLATGIAAVIPLLGPIAVGIGAISAPVLGLAAVLGTAYLAWKNWDKITGFVKGVYDGVRTYLVDKMGAALAWVKEKITAVGDWFFNLYDRVVGHSYVPDLLDGIEFQFGRLQKAMVDPTMKATQTTAEAFRTLASDTQALMDKLFPLQAALRSISADRSTLDNARGAGLISEGEYQAGQAKLGQDQVAAMNEDAIRVPDNTADLEATAQKLSDDFSKTLKPATDLMEIGHSLSDVFHDIGGKAGDALGSITDSIFGQLIPALQQAETQAMSLQEKFGGLANAFGAAVGAIFGKKAGRIAGAIANLGLKVAGTFANGGRPPMGKVSVVGERGPELFVPDQSGTIIPNHQLNLSPPQAIGMRSTSGPLAAAPVSPAPPPVTIHVKPSPYFDAVVDQRAAQVAAPMAVAAGQAGSADAQKTISRRAARRMP